MEQSTIPSTHFSTEDFEIWHETVSAAFDVQRPPDNSRKSFAAAFDAFQLGDMVIADARLDEQRYIRSARQARRDGVDHFVLNLYRTGGWKAQTAQGEFEGKAGQISILDLSCDLVSDEPRSDLVALFVPRALLEYRLPELTALHGRAPTSPYAVLLAEYVELLARRLPLLPDGEAQGLSRATCEMLAACLQPSLASIEAARPGLELVLLRRAKRYIETHLNAPELAAATVCSALGVSRRTLYRLFDHEGGVQRYIQGRRLDRVRSALADPNETRRISEVAEDFGFTRSDHFARAFKNRYGHSASDARFAAIKATEHGPRREGHISGQRFEEWIRTLHG